MSTWRIFNLSGDASPYSRAQPISATGKRKDSIDSIQKRRNNRLRSQYARFKIRDEKQGEVSICSKR